jgi:hypothetical protein
MMGRHYLAAIFQPGYNPFAQIQQAPALSDVPQFPATSSASQSLRTDAERAVEEVVVVKAVAVNPDAWSLHERLPRDKV